MPTRTQELWIFDKVSLEKIVYGEFENNFSCSLTLDQSRDSAKIIVKNYDSNVVLPNTICYMPTLNLWWIIAEDKATRYASEESNGYWEHELQLLGAIEIFAHRDMINCGFNKDRYTLGTMLNRFNNLVDFELPISFDFTYYNENENIGYIKAFENYTPLSAIKEICNGINAIPKLTFEISADELVSATIHIIPKTGIDNTPIDIDDLDEDSEVKTINRSSYGSTVVSNAKNCLSGQIIRYPATGGTMLITDGGEIKTENCFIELPTNIDYVYRLVMSADYYLTFEYKDDDNNTLYITIDSEYDLLSIKGCEMALDYVLEQMQQQATLTGITTDNAQNEIITNYRYLKELLEYSHGWTFYNGTIKEFIPDHLIPSITRKVSFGDRITYEIADYQQNAIYYNQGSNRIEHFNFFNEACYGNNNTNHTIEPTDKTTIPFIGTYVKLTVRKLDNAGFSEHPVKFAVYYKPQMNIKLKQENGLMKKDTNIYNQIGKLVDCNALSKLINSHLSTIKSEEITRYKTYYSFNEVPSIGSIIKNNGVRYIINNLSLDFYELESDYFIKANITLTKEVACKSIMVSGNNNIRDYDCPQNYNVNREQIYRDYYEFDYSLKHKETQYINLLPQIFNNSFFGWSMKNNYVSYIKLKNSAYANDLYFKLDSVCANFQKLYTISVDFKDNNIIGYSRAGIISPVFDITNFFIKNLTLSVPISYVDSLGELTRIELSLISSDNNENCLYKYLQDNLKQKSDIVSFYLTPLINSDIYDYALSQNYFEAKITENSYKKDGLEKPNFQLCSQFNNANDIIIGNEFMIEDKIEVTETNKMIVYGYVENDIPLNEDNWKDHTRPRENISGNIVINDAVTISYDDEERELIIYFYSQLIIDKNGIIVSATPNASSLTGKNISINKIKIDTTTQDTQIVNQTMLLGINNLKGNQTNFLNLYINNWKLK